MSRRYRRDGIFFTKSVDVEVEVDLAEIVQQIEFNADVLAEFGLVKATTIRPVQETWECVARALRHGDQRELVDLLSTLAWDQANVVIRPVL